MRVALNPPEWTLAGVCAVLGAIFLYECLAPLPAFHPPILQLRPRNIARSTVFFSPPSQAAFSVIDQHPLFNPTRKPMDVAQTPGGGAAPLSTAPPPLPQMTLVGVIADSQNQIALVTMQGSPFATSLVVGAAIGGWQVTKITADGIVLQAGALQQTITMNGARPDQMPQNAPHALGIGLPTAPSSMPPRQGITTNEQTAPNGAPH